MQDTQTNVAQILVVDDNAANCLLAQQALEDEGYQVVVARGGVDGIAAFESRRPDCVLLDVRMPELDGFAVCESIRALPYGAEIPVLFLTALRDVDTFDQVLRVGGNDFLTKPLRPAELVARVRSALELKRLGAELREHYELHKCQRDEMLRLQLQKERLAAFIVHDLKNPVNSLDLHAQLLQRHEGLPDDARESVAAIRAQVRQLTRMISNLLDVAKADEGRLVPRCWDWDVRGLVDEVLAEAAVHARGRKVGLQSTIAVERICADRDLVQRVLANLVENALRYSPSETTVTVTAARVPEATELRVADAGHGIAVDMRQKVFDAYVQVDSGTEPSVRRDGRGLGLSFCRLAVEAHGGSIWVEDAKPGATFCLRLPHVS